MEKKDVKEVIIDTLKERSSLKQDVFANTKVAFEMVKTALSEHSGELRKAVDQFDKRIDIGYKSRAEYEAEFRFGGDVLFFYMHTNVFKFDDSHSIWKTSYVKENPLRAYCGMISVYNFLSDSLKYQRVNDIGYLVGRVFVNKDMHFFVEGKRQLGFLYNDFMNSILDQEKAKSIVQSATLYTLDFDLLTPPYDTMKELSVDDILEISNIMKVKTGKRLGFRFQADQDISS